MRLLRVGRTYLRRVGRAGSTAYNRAHMRRAAIVLLPLAIVVLLVILRANGPAPKTADAPAKDFSATRATGVLRELLAEGVPHPMGSAANKRIRQRLEARFRALGYDTFVQRRFACSAASACGMAENVFAVQPGPADGAMVVVTGHYDSVPAGPGASDDGQGIATMLEVARAIRGERFRNRIGFLATDGEELGLVGAEAFVADPALSRHVQAVISVEMRGTYGASNMFETSSGNRWLIRHLASAVERPQASSVFFSIYKLLPNDTDVTVFRRAGKAAINFAALRGVHWYHTALDDLEHFSPRTLQHHGDNTLATLRRLADADLDARSSTDATYFDVLQLFLVWWPEEWTIWMAVASLIALLVAARRTDPRAMTFGVLAAFTTLLVASVAGVGVAQLASLRSGELNFVARPLPIITAMWLTGIAAALLGAAAFNRRKDARALLYGIAIVWHTIGIALALTLPGAAYMFVVPSVLVTLLAWTHVSETTLVVVAGTVAAILFFPLGAVLYEALGNGMAAALAVLIGAYATLVAPLFARYRNGFAALVLAVVAALVGLAQPAYTKERPRPIPLLYVDDPRMASPQWVVWEAPDTLQNVARFTRVSPAFAPWQRGTTYAAPAPRLDLPRVLLSGERKGKLVTVRVRSQRGATRLVVVAKNGVIRRVNGVAPAAGRSHSRTTRDWRFASANGVEEMVVELAGEGPVEVVASDATYPLPPAAAPLLRGREAALATTIHDGDATITRASGRW